MAKKARKKNQLFFAGSFFAYFKLPGTDFDSLPVFVAATGDTAGRKIFIVSPPSERWCATLA